MMTLSEAWNKIRPGDVLFYEGVSVISWWIRAVTSYPPSKVSHVGLLGDHRDEHGSIESYSVVEFREFRGGREVSLDLEIEKNSGRLHIFRPSEVFTEYHPDESGEMTQTSMAFEGHRVVSRMREITGLPYNYRMIVCTFLWKMPVLRMIICNRHSILKQLLCLIAWFLRWLYPKWLEKLVGKRFPRIAGWIDWHSLKNILQRLKRRCNKYSLNHFVCSTAVDYAFSKAGYRLLWKESNFVTPDDLCRSPHLHYVCTLKKEDS